MDHYQPPQRFFHMPKFEQNAALQTRPWHGNIHRPSFKPHMHGQAHNQSQQLLTGQGANFNGKQIRKSIHRRTVDYNAACVKHLENRIWQRDYRDMRVLAPDYIYYPEMVPPLGLNHNPMNSITSKHIRTSMNKLRCPIFSLCWTPEGRRLVTGASSGEFTLWNGLTFNFETILQAHDAPVRTMGWSHNDQWMLTADNSGFIKYWQSNMNNVKMFQAHKEAVRDLSFCPSDTKFTTCSDDGTVRIWDFMKCTEERILRGHGSDVKCVDWHPQKALIISGSKDSQQPIKLWDPRTGTGLATLHAHKNTCLDVKWNQNGNWFLTASRDHLLKVFDVRNIKEEVQAFKGHKQGVICGAWHPLHETLFCSGGYDGAIMFWNVGIEKEVGVIENAHEAMIWKLAWHPLGHTLASGSNDHTTKFWTRNRPGDKMRDRYNLNTLPVGLEDGDGEEVPDSVIPGMGMEPIPPVEEEKPKEPEGPSIPGLDWSEEDHQLLVIQERQEKLNMLKRKKIPYAKPVPRDFQDAWDSGEVAAEEQVEITRESQKDEKKDKERDRDRDRKDRGRDRDKNRDRDRDRDRNKDRKRDGGDRDGDRDRHRDRDRKRSRARNRDNERDLKDEMREAAEVTKNSSGVPSLMDMKTTPTPSLFAQTPSDQTGLVGQNIIMRPPQQEGMVTPLMSGGLGRAPQQSFVEAGLKELRQTTEHPLDTDDRVIPMFAGDEDLRGGKEVFDDFGHFGRSQDFDGWSKQTEFGETENRFLKKMNMGDLDDRSSGATFGNNRFSQNNRGGRGFNNGRGKNDRNMDSDLRESRDSDFRRGSDTSGNWSRENRLGNRDDDQMPRWSESSVASDLDLRGNRDSGSRDRDDRFAQNDNRGMKRSWDSGPGDSMGQGSQEDTGDFDLRRSSFQESKDEDRRGRGGRGRGRGRGRGGRGSSRGDRGSSRGGSRGGFNDKKDWSKGSDQDDRSSERGRGRGRGDRGGRGRGRGRGDPRKSRGGQGK
ncbi:pre-mRNA 3' end processing protein WDR33-like isoform X2 [Lineus longissimus]